MSAHRFGSENVRSWTAPTPPGEIRPSTSLCPKGCFGQGWSLTALGLVRKRGLRNRPPDDTNPVVERIGDVKIAGGIDDNCPWVSKLGH